MDTRLYSSKRHLFGPSVGRFVSWSVAYKNIFGVLFATVQLSATLRAIHDLIRSPIHWLSPISSFEVSTRLLLRCFLALLQDMIVVIFADVSVVPPVCSLHMDTGYWTWIKGAFLVKDDRVLKGPLGRSLRSFARTAHSLRSAPLCSACFARSLCSRARSLTLLTPSCNSWNSWICVHAVIAFHGMERVFGRHQKHALC